MTKEPWQMTYKELISHTTGEALGTPERTRVARFLRDYGERHGWEYPHPFEASEKITTTFASRAHKESIGKALREGKPVPPEVLADYPELAKGEVAMEAVPEALVTPEAPLGEQQKTLDALKSGTLVHSPDLRLGADYPHTISLGNEDLVGSLVIGYGQIGKTTTYQYTADVSNIYIQKATEGIGGLEQLKAQGYDALLKPNGELVVFDSSKVTRGKQVGLRAGVKGEEEITKGPPLAAIPEASVEDVAPELAKGEVGSSTSKGATAVVASLLVVGFLLLAIRAGKQYA